MSVKTQRGLVAGVAATALLGLVLTGCSTSDTPDSSGGGEGGTVSVAVNGGPAMDAVIEAFNDTDPGFTVERADTPQDSGAYRELIGTQLVGGSAPDVIQIPPGGGNNISARVAGADGYYVDLAGEAWAADVPEAAKQQLSLDDALYAVPMTFASIGGVYNQTAIEAAGLEIPDTWSGVLDFCADASAAGKVAYGLGLSDTWTTQLIPYALTSSLVYGANPDFVDEQLAGDATFSDSAWTEALDMYTEMGEAGCFNEAPVGTPYQQVQEAIRAGDTLATVSVSSETASIANGAPEGTELTYAPFPATDDPAETFLPTSVGPAYGINAASDKIEDAKKFLAYLATPEAQVLFANGFGDAAAMAGDETQDSQVAEVAAAFIADDKITTFPDRLWPTPTVQPALWDGVQALFNGQTTTADVLTNMDNAFNEE